MCAKRAPVSICQSHWNSAPTASVEAEHLSDILSVENYRSTVASANSRSAADPSGPAAQTKHLLLPDENAEAAAVSDVNVYVVTDLAPSR
jgi:hypothetical protein